MTEVKVLIGGPRTGKTFYVRNNNENETDKIFVVNKYKDYSKLSYTEFDNQVLNLYESNVVIFEGITDITSEVNKIGLDKLKDKTIYLILEDLERKNLGTFLLFNNLFDVDSVLVFYNKHASLSKRTAHELFIKYNWLEDEKLKFMNLYDEAFEYEFGSYEELKIKC